MNASPEFLAAFDALPVGAYGASFRGRRYRVTKTSLVTGRSQKLEAEELGGTGYVSFNLYRLADGAALLKPCEMETAEVVDFILELVADY